ncbi:acetylxylan esterase [candidate division KSB1 bacterium]|nr:acetylxylan esterase [candidate division KSB1 bacterium]RQW06518.1 MAG: acetylxylan esterase [candidate division KSB1 bacterium]
MKRILPFIIFSLSISLANAQPQEQLIEVLVAPDHANWTYHVGEPVTFTVSVLQFNNPLKNVEIDYVIEPEQMAAIKTESLRLKDGIASIAGGSMQVPGFLRCWVTATVNGKEYKSCATAGFDPEKIAPTVQYPDDFRQFWQKAMEENAKVPMDAEMTLLPERCTEKSNVYQVSLQNFKPGSRFYGILAVPKADGVYPAILRVPGAGARPYRGDTGNADRGIITLEVGIHGVPLDMEPSVYSDMMSSSIDGYWFYNLDDKERYYYKRVYLGCVRAVDFIFSLPQFDGENIGVTGGSQGGALSIVTAGLDKRIKYLAPFYPALCDLTGYLHGRAGGWPHTFKKEWYGDWNNTPKKIETVGYYDVVNFARQVMQSGFYSWGYNDNVCPPTTMYAAYNVIDAPKELVLAQDTWHWAYPEQYAQSNEWLVAKLKGE